MVQAPLQFDHIILFPLRRYDAFLLVAQPRVPHQPGVRGLRRVVDLPRLPIDPLLGNQAHAREKVVAQGTQVPVDLLQRLVGLPPLVPPIADNLAHRVEVLLFDEAVVVLPVRPAPREHDPVALRPGGHQVVDELAAVVAVQSEHRIGDRPPHPLQLLGDPPGGVVHHRGQLDPSHPHIRDRQRVAAFPGLEPAVMAHRVHLEKPGSPLVPIEVDPDGDLVAQHAARPGCATPAHLPVLLALRRHGPVYRGGADIQQRLPVRRIEAQPFAAVQVVDVHPDELLQQLGAHAVEMPPYLQDRAAHLRAVHPLAARLLASPAPVGGLHADPHHLSGCLGPAHLPLVRKDVDGVLAVVTRALDKLVKDEALLPLARLPIPLRGLPYQGFPLLHRQPHSQFLHTLSMKDSNPFGLGFLILRKLP